MVQSWCVSELYSTPWWHALSYVIHWVYWDTYGRKWPIASVPLMLWGKKFPQNMRALRMVAEEVLRDVLLNVDVHSFEDMISLIDTRAKENGTTSLWVDSLIKPVILMMQFVRAEREGDWSLHLSAATAMLPNLEPQAFGITSDMGQKTLWRWKKCLRIS